MSRKTSKTCSSSSEKTTTGRFSFCLAEVHPPPPPNAHPRTNKRTHARTHARESKLHVNKAAELNTTHPGAMSRRWSRCFHQSRKGRWANTRTRRRFLLFSPLFLQLWLSSLTAFPRKGGRHGWSTWKHRQAEAWSTFLRLFLRLSSRVTCGNSALVFLCGEHDKSVQKVAAKS